MRQILSTMKIDGDRGVLTETLSRSEYVEVNDILTSTGAKWSKGQKAHIWVSGDPQTKINAIVSGQTNTVTTTKEARKEFQFFPTPSKLADTLVSVALGGTKFEGWKPEKILEPSGGQGSIILSIQKWFQYTVEVDTYELMPENRSILSGLSNVNVLGDDFLRHDTNNKYDLIVFNVPFSKHQDVVHVRHIYNTLNEGGRMVGIMGLHSFTATHKVDVQFREWLETTDHCTQKVEAGAFRASGTMVSSMMLIANK